MDEKHQVKKICPIYKTSCNQSCGMRAFLQGQECPVLVDPAGLDYLKDMIREAAQYLDEVTGIKDSPQGGIVDKLINSAVDGRMDIKRLLDDLEKSLDI